ncbi:MAG: SsrA-binding protein [Flammeovirgaceae bacterium]|jgi:SsrA-binding protein|nr:SsrA-binding protein [Flammeovirgaceae bacterium]|tara:strand:+ start:25751 stop:26218 length:468 start_codon:yes stop_codon:yes gene_type:complete
MKNKKDRFANDISIRNRKAQFNYELIEKLEVGIMLLGSEIKSIREGKASLQEAHCIVSKGELFVRSMNISPYIESSYYNHEPTRERKLLLSKKDIEKLRAKTEEKGLTLIPTKLYINSRGFAKMEIALAKGKKLHDKRDSLKRKDQERELNQTRL